MSFITEIVSNDPINVLVVNAPYHRIIDADCTKNYAGKGIDPAMARLGFDLYKAEGGAFMATDNVIIIYKDVGAGTVEFHTMNAGSGRDVTAAVEDFFQQAAKDFDFAVTFYDNPEISGLFKFFSFPSVVSRIDDGEDRTFKALVDLRGGI